MFEGLVISMLEWLVVANDLIQSATARLEPWASPLAGQWRILEH